MPSIADVTRARRGRSSRRMVAGVWLLVVGTVFMGLGTANVIGATSLQTKLVIVAGMVLSGVLAVGVRAELDEHERAVVAIGAILSLASLLTFWGFVPGGIVSTSYPIVIVTAVSYLGGISIALAAILAAVSMPFTSYSRSTTPTVAWTRSSTPDERREAASDGGVKDSDITGFDEKP